MPASIRTEKKRGNDCQPKTINIKMIQMWVSFTLLPKVLTLCPPRNAINSPSSTLPYFSASSPRYPASSFFGCESQSTPVSFPVALSLQRSPFLFTICVEPIVKKEKMITLCGFQNPKWWWFWTSNRLMKMAAARTLKRVTRVKGWLDCVISALLCLPWKTLTCSITMADGNNDIFPTTLILLRFLADWRSFDLYFSCRRRWNNKHGEQPEYESHRHSRYTCSCECLVAVSRCWPVHSLVITRRRYKPPPLRQRIKT